MATVGEGRRLTRLGNGGKIRWLWATPASGRPSGTLTGEEWEEGKVMESLILAQGERWRCA